jgi:hypothetical protein
VVSRWGGAAEGRVLLRGVSLPAPQAALLNVSMGHALDFDDTLDTGGSIHPGVSVLGPALALCDNVGRVTGKELLSAVALGLDVSCRIGLASTVDRGWHRTAAMGVFGAAAASGKLLRLTPEQMLAAFGIAYSHAAGNRQCILDGALTKRLQAGQAASAGVFSAALAQTGFTGARNIFGGRFGFFELYQPNGYDAAALLADLGTAFRGGALLLFCSQPVLRLSFNNPAAVTRNAFWPSQSRIVRSSTAPTASRRTARFHLPAHRSRDRYRRATSAGCRRPACTA